MRRYWGVLVVLAGVFAMHGLQCTSHDLHTPAGHGAGATLVSLSLPAAVDAVDPGPPDALDGSGASAAPDHGEHAASPPALDGPSSPLPADFWIACLAVLAAGLALLTAFLRAWPAADGLAPWVPVPRWVSVPTLLRPPDLFALCVLRN